MTLGRLSSSERYKGVDEVLDVLPELARSCPDVCYLVAGDGDDRPRLEARARELGLQDRVVFAGFVDESEKADYFRLADVFAMPSSGEGFGFVFLEALACGIPVVASRVDGSREAVLDGELGEVVDPADRDSVRSAIVRALQKPRAIPPGLEHFSWPRFRQRVAAAVDSLRPSNRQAA
jgi:glycosyltransferase involved in cell wall biosynthesis